jgi:hypothetical protein
VKIIAAAGNDSRHELTPAATSIASSASGSHLQAHPQVKKKKSSSIRLSLKALSQSLKRALREPKESLKRA